MTGRKQKYPQDLKETPADKATGKGPVIKFKHALEPRTAAQRFYLDMLSESDITFCSGPAGCGKTWLAAHHALSRLFNNEVDQIVVTKPILEAGSEKLGHLPGMVEDKILPHFQSVLDCFEDHVGPTMLKKLIDGEKIKFLPTAFCRGRNIKHSYILIDEAQNLTRKGIKLLLTRIAEGSYMSVNGDTDQCDLPNIRDSGFLWAIESLTGKSPNIATVEFGPRDIQRHPLIEVIIRNLQ